MTETNQATRKRSPRRPVFERTMRGPRVKRALESLEIDTEEFRQAYEDVSGSGPRAATTEEIEAVNRFHDTGDYAGLKQELGLKTDASVARVLARVSKAVEEETAEEPEESDPEEGDELEQP